MAVLFLEINETAWHFVEKFAAQGKLPNFSRIAANGASIRTHIPDVDATNPRFTRNTSPWIVWSSVYTGMRAATHELIGFGQDTSHVVGKYLWDVLARAGRSYGVFGSLISFPPRADAKFYIPDGLASAPDCIPISLRPLQKFFLFGAHHYSESGISRFAHAGLNLAHATGSALSVGAAVRAFAQLPKEMLLGGPAKADRAMLHSILTFDAFERLQRRFCPDFATVHFNHIAYYQHRYWRASEPTKFSDALSSTDRRFYSSVAERKSDEASYANKIEQAYLWTDLMIGRVINLLADGDYLAIGSGLGQRPYDPVSEIHNPVVRFNNAELFFSRLGLEGIIVRHEMNPDLTIDCLDDADAQRYESIVLGLYWNDGTPVFFCQRRRRQLFLELIVSPHVEHNPNAIILHRDRKDFSELSRDYVWQSEINEQSTAHHVEQGLFMVWRKGAKISSIRDNMLVTEIAPTLLNVLGIGPQDWHHDYAGPVLKI